MLILFECPEYKHAPTIQIALEVVQYPDGRKPALQAKLIEDGEVTQLISSPEHRAFFRGLSKLVTQHMHLGYRVACEE